MRVGGDHVRALRHNHRELVVEKLAAFEDQPSRVPHLRHAKPLFTAHSCTPPTLKEDLFGRRHARPLCLESFHNL